MRAAPRLKAVVRRIGGRGLTRLRRSRQKPDLSVVMPVYNVAEYLPAALDSVLSQSLKSLEVVAVDDGSTDACLEILRDYERRDFRVRVLTQSNAGQGVARNNGVDLARGEFLTFLDSDDTLPQDAYETMVEGLRLSGSDFSVGNLRRLQHGRLHRMIWSRTVHRQDRIATTIEEFPNAMQDIIACNRMFRTTFWREQVGTFEGGIAYEDHVPMLAAYVRATTFDVLQKVTYHWRIREDLTSTGQQKARLGNLRDRIAVKQEAHELLEAEASEAVYAAWVGRALEVDFPPFLPFALTGDDDYRALLAETYRTFLDRASQQALSQVRVAMRLRAHLAAQERWDDLFAADDWLRELQNLPPTEVVDGRLVAAFPPECTWADALPDDQLWMSPLECHFEGAVEHLEWGDDSLRVTGWAWLRGLTMRGPAEGTTVQAWLVDSATRATRLPLELQQLRLPEADEWGPLAHASPAGGGFVATVDLAALDREAWFVEVRVEQDGLGATGELHGRVARSAAVRESAGTVGGLAVTAGWDAGNGLTLRVTPGLGLDPVGAEIEVSSVELDEATVVLTVSGTVDAHARPRLVSPRHALLADDIGTEAGQTRVSFALTAPDLDDVQRPAPSGSYRLELAGRWDPRVSRELAGRAPQRFHGHGCTVEAGQRPDGEAVVVVSAPLRPDERGPFNQERLRRGALDSPTNDDVLLLSGDGSTVSGDPLAMGAWVEAELPHLECHWGTTDRRVATPRERPGLVIGSAEWHHALSASALVVTDGDLQASFTRRERQRVLRTFCHPVEAVGVARWRREGMIEHLVNREVLHCRRQWSCLLAPDEESAAVLREQFRWEGEVLVAGSPHTDAIVNADREEVRARVLRRLDLPADAVLVLHAPAARDDHDLANPAGRSGLDLARLLGALPEDHVVLRRAGSAVRGERPPAQPRVRDVDDYPGLTDLVVAADVAVLDYSSLRFDWALTGKPMLFHVPDLEQWHEHRETAFAWDETAPGPWLRTLDELVEQLREPGRVAAAYADALGAFNRRFNALNDGHATERAMSHLFPG